ncbi:MAG TPA: hypothetical protein VD928_03860 [Candidatus Paceibacterota bacterium]|nr:hypothetical protein [Candidatus Paceibacterota bacterium]
MKKYVTIAATFAAVFAMFSGTASASDYTVRPGTMGGRVLVVENNGMKLDLNLAEAAAREYLKGEKEAPEIERCWDNRGKNVVCVLADDAVAIIDHFMIESEGKLTMDDAVAVAESGLKQNPDFIVGPCERYAEEVVKCHLIKLLPSS